MATVNSEVERVDQERKHLEGLLKDRINFYLLFASVFLVGLARIDEGGPLRVVALGAMTLVSGLIGTAVIRTHRLVQQALDEIIASDQTHPYTRYQKKVGRLPPNANKILVWVPVLLTLCFFGATVYFCNQP